MAQLYIIAFKLYYKSHIVESHLNLLPLVLSHRNIFLERVNNILLQPPPKKKTSSTVHECTQQDRLNYKRIREQVMKLKVILDPFP